MSESLKTIRLTKYVADPRMVSNQHAWPLVITAEGVNMPEEIFVYQHNNANGWDGDTFHNVASVHDLYEFPKMWNNNVMIHKSDELQIPFYRRNRVDFMVRSPSELEDIWAKVQADTTELVENYALDDNLKSAGTVEISVESPNEEPVVLPVSGSSAMTNVSSYPSGDLSVDLEGEQIIVAPFSFTQPGWLPTSEAEALGYTLPAETRFFYNIEASPDLAQYFPGITPAQFKLELNSQLLPYEVVYEITDETIIWKQFSNTVAENLGLENNLPWTDDFVDPENPGDNPNVFTATVTL